MIDPRHAAIDKDVTRRIQGLEDAYRQDQIGLGFLTAACFGIGIEYAERKRLLDQEIHYERKP